MKYFCLLERAGARTRYLAALSCPVVALRLRLSFCQKVSESRCFILQEKAQIQQQQQWLYTSEISVVQHRSRSHLSRRLFLFSLFFFVGRAPIGDPGGRQTAIEPERSRRGPGEGWCHPGDRQNEGGTRRGRAVHDLLA